MPKAAAATHLRISSRRGRTFGWRSASAVTSNRDLTACTVESLRELPSRRDFIAATTMARRRPDRPRENYRSSSSPALAAARRGHAADPGDRTAVFDAPTRGRPLPRPPDSRRDTTAPRAGTGQRQRLQIHGRSAVHREFQRDLAPLRASRSSIFDYGRSRGYLDDDTRVAVYGLPPSELPARRTFDYHPPRRAGDVAPAPLRVDVPIKTAVSTVGYEYGGGHLGKVIGLA